MVDKDGNSSMDHENSAVTEDETKTIKEEHLEDSSDEADDCESRKNNSHDFYKTENILNLCQVCGRPNEDQNKFVLINKYEKDLIKTLKKCFSIVVSEFDDANYQICIVCKAYITSLSGFCDHVERVQRMIEVIKDLSIENIKFEIDAIRKIYRIFTPNMELYLIENLKEKGCDGEKNENINLKNNSFTNNLSRTSQDNVSYIAGEEQLIDLKVIELDEDDEEMLDDENYILVENDNSQDNFEFETINEDENYEEITFDDESSLINDEASLINDDSSLINDENFIINDKTKTKKTQKPKTKKPKGGKYSFECNICFKKYYGPRQFYNHKIKVHNTMPPQKKLNQEEARKNLKYCEICDRNFNHECFLTIHYETCHNIKREITCDYCGEKFNTTIKLNYHLRKHLPKEELLKISQFQCSYCQKKFLNKTSLNTHIKGNHEILKDYICEICGKSFTCSNYLCLHRRHEHVDQPTECPICKCVFKNFSKMRCHQHAVHGSKKKKPKKRVSKNYVKKYLGEQTLNCPCCVKAYRSIEALNIHMVKHTNTKPFKCRLCGKGFTAPSHCKKHVKVIHRQDATDDCYIGEIPSFEELELMIGINGMIKVEEADNL